MRVRLLILLSTLSMAQPAAAQFYSFEGPPTLGMPQAGGIKVPIGSAEGLDYLETSALLGDRNASALLAVLLQDMPQTAGNLVKSALHFQLAVAAGCSDLEILAARAVARLSSEQRAAYDAALPRWVPATDTTAKASLKGPCLSW